jgi:hypothetical protein
MIFLIGSVAPHDAAVPHAGRWLDAWSDVLRLPGNG